MNISFIEKQKKYISVQPSGADGPRPEELSSARMLEELCVEIDKGWGGTASKRNVKDIINARTKARKK
jgi:hypothetical protein